MEMNVIKFEESKIIEKINEKLKEISLKPGDSDDMRDFTKSLFKTFHSYIKTLKKEQLLEIKDDSENLIATIIVLFDNTESSYRFEFNESQLENLSIKSKCDILENPDFKNLVVQDMYDNCRARFSDYKYLKIFIYSILESTKEYIMENPNDVIDLKDTFILQNHDSDIELIIKDSLYDSGIISTNNIKE